MLEPHIWPDTARDIDGNLELGGCLVRDLVRTYGTPLYILDRATVAATAQAYQAALAAHYPAPAQIHYASKALLNTGVARLMHHLGLGLDCVSLGEVAVARRAGVDASHIHLHGNAKPSAELRQALAWGVGRIVVDNLDELHALGQLTVGQASPSPIWLRLNPGVDVHTHAHIQTGQLDSKFGLPIDTGMARAALELAQATPGIEVVGLHAHLGSQLSDAQAMRRGVARLMEFAAQMRQELGIVFTEFSPGGGLAVAYRAADPLLDIAHYVAALCDELQQQCQRWDYPLPRLVLEPGRSMIARAVVGVYEVVSIKQIEGVRTYVAVDGGMGDNIRPALYQAHYTVRRADASPPGATLPVTIAGRYCESGDILARDVALPPLLPGALLAFAQAGAYTLSMASNYNLVPRPALVLVENGGSRLLQRRETLDDLVARDVEEDDLHTRAAPETQATI